MRNAYALLGLSFLIVFGIGYVSYERAHAPTSEELPLQSEQSESTLVPLESMLTLTSSVFEDGGLLPRKYTCDGENINPDLRMSNVPEGTSSFVLVMDDPDIPETVKESLGISKFNHWVLYNIPGDTLVIPENTTVGIEGKTTRGTEGYVGACPPDKEHRYFFRVYALPSMLTFEGVPSLEEVESAAQKIAISSAVLMGRYDRK